MSEDKVYGAGKADEETMDRCELIEKELAAAKKRLEPWHKRAEKVVKRFLDDRTGGTDGLNKSSKRLNLFHSDIVTMKSMLYGNLPKVDVSRRFNDANDDVGRICSLMLQRLLTNDIQANGKEYGSVLRSVLEDRLLPGMGCAKVRYIVSTEEVEQPAITVPHPDTGENVELAPAVKEERITHEDAVVDYYHWRDVLWGWARNWSEIPWIAFRSYLTKKEVEERFPDYGEELEYKRRDIGDTKTEGASSKERRDPEDKAEIWEVWTKNVKKVEWFSFGCDECLDEKDDPLHLTGFFPCPPFLIANATTSLYDPVPDFYMAQDLYNTIDILETRISILTRAVKAVGVYDKNQAGIQRMFSEAVENDLVPVEKWAVLGEKGGLRGVIDWMPIKDISDVLDKLRSLRDENINLLHQITGQSDIMRGQSSGTVKSATEQGLKAKFASVRVQALQDEFAQWASDLMELKGEIASRHFDIETIMKRSNAQFLSEDQQAVQQAAQMFKDWDAAALRVVIRPESVAMVDYADLKQERTDFITALATFMQSAAPLVELNPGSTPFLLELLKWGLAGFKGAQEIEGVMDKAIQQLQQQQKQGGGEKEDPAAATEKAKQETEKIKQQGMQQKNEGDMQLKQFELQMKEKMAQMEIAAKEREAALDLQIEQMKLQFEQFSQQIKMRSEQASAEQTERHTEEAHQAQMIRDKQEAEAAAAQAAKGDK